MGGNYTSPARLAECLPIDAHDARWRAASQALVPDGPAADHFIADARRRTLPMDVNSILNSLSSSADDDPQPGLATIKTKVCALKFADGEFNPTKLHALEELMPKVRSGEFIAQPGPAESFGQLTMAHPELWSADVARFVRELGDDVNAGSRQ